MDATEPLLGYRWFDPNLYLVGGASKTRLKRGENSARSDVAAVKSDDVVNNVVVGNYESQPRGGSRESEEQAHVEIVTKTS